MKKLFLSFMALSPMAIFACSSCNVDYTDAEKKAFVIATLLLILIPFSIGFALYKFLKKSYK